MRPAEQEVGSPREVSTCRGVLFQQPWTPHPDLGQTPTVSGAPGPSNVGKVCSMQAVTILRIKADNLDRGGLHVGLAFPQCRGGEWG